MIPYTLATLFLQWGRGQVVSEPSTLTIWVRIPLSLHCFCKICVWKEPKRTTSGRGWTICSKAILVGTFMGLSMTQQVTKDLNWSKRYRLNPFSYSLWYVILTHNLSHHATRSERHLRSIWYFAGRKNISQLHSGKTGSDSTNLDRLMHGAL